ncbi:hypothetical protein [Streptomyces sp. 142MFCol3.1]|uniref:hypothetical protein n=1 Tax=Streptomyces sp. 142MFCol3.1 TaxID=1172179 RepID=UPI001319DD81|nr:hypothetical protein [Streptomyces sp. 142MFCol3.1]
MKIVNNQANVVVVRPPAAGRRGGGRAAWIGLALDEDCAEELIGWATAGGPGVAEPPAALELHFVRPPRGTRSQGRRGRGAGRHDAPRQDVRGGAVLDPASGQDRSARVTGPASRRTPCPVRARGRWAGR